MVCRTHDSAYNADSRLWDLPLNLRACSLSPTPFKRFSLNLPKCFISVRGCAEYMTQGQGHTSRSWDLPLNFVSAPYLFNPLIFFIKLYPDVPLIERVCRTHDSAMQTQGQGHTSRSWDLPLNFMVDHISSTL